ncbi:hypothetical protein [Moorena producens]|uniref:hypothetical protein n=1 Tax=Moorena producens TaxID=1155739 RepID=UPI003C73645C
MTIIPYSAASLKSLFNFASCLLPFASCLLPFAFCLLPFAFCLKIISNIPQPKSSTN